MDGWMDGWMDGCMHACMHACMDAWMHGCMDAWMHGCMDAWMHGCMDAWMHGCMDAWMHGCMDAWMHGCTDARMHGCMDAWMHGCMDAWMHGCMDAWMHVEFNLLHSAFLKVSCSAATEKGSFQRSPRCVGGHPRSPLEIVRNKLACPGAQRSGLKTQVTATLQKSSVQNTPVKNPVTSIHATLTIPSSLLQRSPPHFHVATNTKGYLHNCSIALFGSVLWRQTTHQIRPICAASSLKQHVA